LTEASSYFVKKRPAEKGDQVGSSSTSRPNRPPQAPHNSASLLLWQICETQNETWSTTPPLTHLRQRERSQTRLTGGALHFDVIFAIIQTRKKV
jgi:hypothetical protein